MSLTVFGLVLVAVGLFVGLSYRMLLSQYRYRISRDNQNVGIQLTRIIAEHHLASAPRAHQVAVLESIVEKVKLPNDGFVCAVDDAGHILAMPTLYKGLSTAYTNSFFSDFKSRNWRRFSQIPKDAVFRGLAQSKGRTDVVAVLPVEGTGIRVVVHQSMHDIKKQLLKYFSPLFYLGLVVALVFGLITYYFIHRIIRGYEHRIEAVNQELAHSHGELMTAHKERELYYQSVYNSPHGMMITDASGKIVGVNPAFENLYGFGFNEVVGRKPEIIIPGTNTLYNLGISEEDRRELFDDIWKRIADPTVGFWEGDVPHKQKDGTVIWVRLLISAIFDHKGKITNYIWLPVDITDRMREEFAIRMDIYRTITDLAERRDNETGRHLFRVSAYAKLLSRYLGLPEKFCDEIGIFAPLHDIGKVGILDQILLAPRRFTREEFEIMKTHTSIGFEILKGKPTLEMAAEIAYCHHEKFDGTGYPRGIKGKQIPLSARIVAIADVYDALRSKRPYKQSWSHEDTIAEINSQAGVHFDPVIVKAFMEVADDFGRFSRKYAD